MSITNFFSKLRDWDNWSQEERISFEAEIGAWDNLPKGKWYDFFQGLDKRELDKLPEILPVSRFIDLLERELDKVTPESLLYLSMDKMEKEEEYIRELRDQLTAEDGEMFHTTKGWCEKLSRRGFGLRKILLKVFLQTLFRCIFFTLEEEKDCRKENELVIIDDQLKKVNKGIQTCTFRLKDLDYISSGGLYADISSGEGCFDYLGSTTIKPFVAPMYLREGYIDYLGSTPIYSDIEPYIPLPLNSEIDCAIMRNAGCSYENIKGIEEKGDEKFQAFVNETEMNKLKLNSSYEQVRYEFLDKRDKLINNRESITKRRWEKWRNIFYRIQDLCLSIGWGIKVKRVVPIGFFIDDHFDDLLYRKWDTVHSSWDSDTLEFFDVVRKLSLLLTEIVLPKREKWSTEYRKSVSLRF